METTEFRRQTGNAFYMALLKLEPSDDAQRALKTQAVSAAVELGQLLSLMEAESTTSISAPMLIVVVFWLVIIFLGFGVIAAPNSTAKLALVASACCAAGAIFLILELDQPFSGFLRVSSEPMVKVLGQMGK
jgi:hypothetical protein